MAASDERASDADLIGSILDCSGPFDLVLAHLDARSLLNWTLCRKSNIRMLRYEHVFLSSFGEWNLQNQVQLIRKRAIWVPTPLRMLRLANAPFGCELCDRWRDPTLRPTLSGGTQKSFGLSICYIFSKGFTGCRDDERYTKILPPNEPKPTDDRILNHRLGYGKNYRWNGRVPFRDTCGNLCGPYLNHSEWNSPQCEDLYEERMKSDPNAKDIDEILSVFDRCERKYNEQSMRLEMERASGGSKPSK